MENVFILYHVKCSFQLGDTVESGVYWQMEELSVNIFDDNIVVKAQPNSCTHSKTFFASNWSETALHRTG
ncbi:hypothetical protein RRG08_023243 [Elysia crispata]|uniref:Uncharacterized protein n=1 Tax=Elysia crispata TaxID=231223 RepID=A0AAE0ZPT0_9GAST|nr:hypothetical protein RRG08_023243 [Elysia crispata]